MRHRTAKRLPYRRPRDFNIAFGFALLAALLHTYTLITELKRAAEFNTSNTSTVPLLFLAVEFGLLLNVAGLCLRRAAGILISLVALSVSGVGHAIWYIQSRQILEMLRADSFYHSYPEAIAPHPLGLLGATWVNLVVLVITGILFVWDVKTLRGMMKAVPDVAD